MQPKRATAMPGFETIEELFEALESPLLGYALQMAGELGVAEDIVQEAFMRLQAQFQEVRQPRPWLYRTVHNLALNHRRQGRKIISLQASTGENSASDVDPPDPQPLPDEQLARLEGIGLVRLTLETLDERSRQLIQLKFSEGLSYQQMSVRTGLKMGHIGYLLHHALKSMAQELARNGIVP